MKFNIFKSNNDVKPNSTENKSFTEIKSINDRVDFKEIKNDVDYEIIKNKILNEGFIIVNSKPMIKIFRAELAIYFLKLDSVSIHFFNRYKEGYYKGVEIFKSTFNIERLLIDADGFMSAINKISSERENYSQYEIKYLNGDGFYKQGEDAGLIYEAQALLNIINKNRK